MNKVNPLINKAPLFKKSTKTPYENNPFFVALSGLELLFKQGRSVAITLAIVTALFAFTSAPGIFTPPAAAPADRAITTQQSEREAEEFIRSVSQIPGEVIALGLALIFAMILILTLFGTVIQGVQDSTSARLARGNQTTITEAFRTVFGNFWGYLWVLVLVTIKTFLWSLLFIIPGIIMAVRYSLAGVAYFDKQLKGNAAIKESLALTKNAWLTTYASQALLNIVTLGLIPLLIGPGTRAVLYRQYSATKTKPKAHVLSWLTLIIPILLVLSLVLLGYSVVNYIYSQQL